MVVVGDVAGQGARAAALTGLARFTLRTAGQITGDPARAAEQLNRTLRAEPDLSLCTAVCVLIAEGDESGLTAMVVSLGHPLPVLLRAGTATELGAPGPLAGAFDDAEWPVTPARLERGDALVLYTDGVFDTVGVEARLGRSACSAAGGGAVRRGGRGRRDRSRAARLPGRAAVRRHGARSPDGARSRPGRRRRGAGRRRGGRARVGAGAALWWARGRDDLARRVSRARARGDAARRAPARAPAVASAPPPGDHARFERELKAAEGRVAKRRAAVPRIGYPPQLPVSRRREDLLAAIRNNQVVVVAGETGSGKTTQLPKLCLELGRGVRGTIGHTQPRRLAARTVAERIAAELSVPLGEAVGYAVRFSDRSRAETLVRLMTDGLLLAEIRRDPLLRALRHADRRRGPRTQPEHRLPARLRSSGSCRGGPTFK